MALKLRTLKQNKDNKGIAHSARECAYLAIFVAIVIGLQLALSAVPGVELVTVLFVAYSFTLGARRGMLAATVFTLIRQVVFGLYPTVLVLYLVYYNLLAMCFGLIGSAMKKPMKWIVFLVIIACLCTVSFNMLDNILTPLWLGYGKKSTMLYFKASLIVRLSQVLCTAVTVAVLFFPLHKVFYVMKRNLATT